MAKAIMLQGTMSNVGKSILTAGLCRIFAQDGYTVAPFKSQNMALNSYITSDGLEIGRAQAVQAEACGIPPSADMNPVLLKPTTDCGSQIIVGGKPRCNMSAADYFSYKTELIPEIMSAYERLAAENDIIVIEGAGSPAEINLKHNDIVNMGMARLAHAPVLLIGDIDPGGVFAQLAGTLLLLTDEERCMVKATVINKFRGDVSLLRPGLSMLEELTAKPVAGVVPMLNIDIDDEDSQSRRLSEKRPAALDIAVISLPRMSNYTDFSALAATGGVSVRYVKKSAELKNPDLIILPGSKSTIADLNWLKSCGLFDAVKAHAAAKTPIIGICGGYQLLGESITDSVGAEGGGSAESLGLLPVETDFTLNKHCSRTRGRIINAENIFAPLMSAPAKGYEIHMGETSLAEGAKPFIELEDGSFDGCTAGNIIGTYLHGIFDDDELRCRLLFLLCDRKKIPRSSLSLSSYDIHRQQEYDKLADALRQSLDMPMIYKILEEGL